MPSASSIEASRTTIAHFFEVLRIRGVDICVLRNYEDVSDGNARDVDCIPAIGQLRALEEAICAWAKQTDACLDVVHRQYVHSFHIMFGNGVLFTIDVIPDIQGWWGAAYLYNEEIWDGARRQGDFWIPRPAHEAAMAFFQHLLWGGFYKRKYVERLPLLIEQDEQEFRRIIAEHFGRRWLCLIDWIKQKDVTDIEKHVRGLRKDLWGNALKRDCQNSLSRFVVLLAREGAITLKERGLLVVLVGPDGVGKTTLAGALKSDWDDFFRDVLYFHFRPPVIHGLSATIPQGGELQLCDPFLRPTFVARIASPARLLVSIVRFNLGYWLRIFPALLRQKLVIADRYFYSYLLFPESVRYYGPRWLARCLARLFPRPDLVFALYAPTDVIRMRKSELPEWAIAKQINNLPTICSIADTRLTDADRPLDEIVQACKAHVMQSLVRKSGQSAAGWQGDVSRPRLPTSILSSDFRQTSSTRTQWQQESLNDAVRLDGGRWMVFSTASGAQYIIPTMPRKVAAASLGLYRPRKLVARASKKLLSAALRCGMAQPLLRHPDNAHGFTKGQREWWEDATLPEELTKLLGVRKVSLSFLVGRPNDQKLVAQVMDHKANILGFLKIGCGPEGIDALHHEESVLRRLQTHQFSTSTVPNVIYAGYWNNYYLLLQGCPRVHTETSPGRITYQHITFLLELYGIVPPTQLASNEFLGRIRERLTKLEKLGYSSFIPPVLNVLEEFHSGVGESNVIFGFMHGDFAPWNMLRARNQLFVFDWENAQVTSTPGWDLFHFIVQNGILVHQLPARQIYKSMFDEGGSTHKCVDAYFVKSERRLNLFDYACVYMSPIL